MTSFINQTVYYLHQYWIDIGDPRTAHYPMVSNLDNKPKITTNLITCFLFVNTPGERRPVEDCRRADHLLAAGEEGAAGVHAGPEAVLAEKHHSNVQHVDGDRQPGRLLQALPAHRLRPPISRLHLPGPKWHSSGDDERALPGVARLHESLPGHVRYVLLLSAKKTESNFLFTWYALTFILLYAESQINI